MPSTTLRAMLLGSCAAALIMAATPAAAQADPMAFDIPSQPLGAALNQFAQQSKIEILFSSQIARDLNAPAIQGKMEPREALAMLLAQSGLSYRATPTGSFVIEAADPQSGSAAGDGADQGAVQALIVTAQKREEQIQDVPIAISAFTEKSLEEQKIEGGFDLLKAIPNVTFSKNNFTSYNFSIRGVGTKAISATTDPGVAVSFNNIALIQNRLFEQEYFDIERVEVLRGPQGTLYGRNATAGVINVISAKPNLHEFDGWIKGEVGNYHTKRVSAMVNVPLVEDKLAIRLAGALTDRQGYDFNEITGHAINGRDLWSGRITVAFKPTDSIRSNLIWEHFEEDDDRSRTGKQLCHRDQGPTEVDGAPVTGIFAGNDYTILRQAMFSQGCKAGSLYDSGAFDTPNGIAEPFVFANLVLQYGGIGGSPGSNPDGTPAGLLKLEDPYRGLQQSHDLRTIASIADPKYRAEADVLELNVDIDLTDHLTFTSQTAYDKDQVYSFQDFNRFNTEPVFNDSSQWLTFFGDAPSDYRDVSRGGQFCDPQLGCSNRMVSFDISQAKSQQFSQELRLQSDFDGPLNFSVGANYTRFNVLVDYYVFNNLVTSLALFPLFNTSQTSHAVALDLCGYTYYSLQTDVPVSSDDPRATCPYIDLTPIENLAGDGHNYFRSKNPYKLSSAAAFGEVYWQLKDDVKITAGLRYTDDKKTFIPVPSQILLAPTFIAGGTVSRGYPELAPIKQHWGEWTGRLGVDWKPDLSFTDETMLYAFYSRGYKGGGANPPSPGFANHDQARAQAAADPTVTPDFLALLDSLEGFFPTLTLAAVEYGPTFKPEFVNAFEVGAKNTLLGGALTFNTDAFFYDYKDYQVSQIRDRTAVNENFDAQTWGLEFETTFAPTRHLQFIANLGYLDTKIAKGMKSIDIMNRTQGNPDWMVVKPWMQYPSNCIAPVGVVKNWVLTTNAFQNYWAMCGKLGGLFAFSNITPIDPATDAPYDLANYPDVHNGAGFYADLGGNELPNAPHWTANLGAQYSWDMASDWTATVRGDAYWQSQSWARVYNLDPYDKLHGWYNVNLSVWFERPDDELKIELYAKNLLDDTPITDAFLNSDDSALTTNVFVLDPRLIGLSIRKGF